MNGDFDIYILLIAVLLRLVAITVSRRTKTRDFVIWDASGGNDRHKKQFGEDFDALVMGEHSRRWFWLA